MKIRNVIKNLCVDIIKSIIVNIYHFGFKGLIKMPIILHYGSNIKAYKNSIIFEQPLKCNMLTLLKSNNIFIAKGGKMILHGTKATFNYQNGVLIGSQGVIELGDSFYANGLAEINCRKKIVFGNNCLLSVHTMFLDTDYHSIFTENKRINPDKEIVIGDRVWIGCNVTILKGTVIGNDIVIGAGSVLSGKYIDNNSIYVGNNPVKKIKSGITWSNLIV